jgi:hypothetical protein
VVHAADKSRAIELLVSLRIGEDVKNRIDGRRDRSFNSDLCVIAHTSTLSKFCQNSNVGPALPAELPAEVNACIHEFAIEHRYGV